MRSNRGPSATKRIDAADRDDNDADGFDRGSEHNAAEDGTGAGGDTTSDDGAALSHSDGGDDKDHAARHATHERPKTTDMIRSYAEWSKAKRDLEETRNDYGFLCRRVQRLVAEEQHMRSEVAAARQRLTEMDEARTLLAQHRASADKRQQERLADQSMSQNRLRELREHDTHRLSEVKRQLLEKRRREVAAIKALSERHDAVIVAHALAEQRKRKWYRDAVKSMQERSSQKHREAMEHHERSVRESNRKEVSHLAENRAQTMDAASRVVLVEAGLLRSLAALKREQEAVIAEIRDRVVARPPPPRSARAPRAHPRSTPSVTTSPPAPTNDLSLSGSRHAGHMDRAAARSEASRDSAVREVGSAKPYRGSGPPPAALPPVASRRQGGADDPDTDDDDDDEGAAFD